MNQLLSAFLENPNVRFVVLGTLILGASAAIVGTFSFLRKRALVGDAISHSILPGVCLAFMFSGTKNPFYLIIGAFVTGLLAIMLIDKINNRSKISVDTAVGLVLSVFFGIGILLLTSIQNSGNSQQAGLDKFLFGQAASLTRFDIYVFSGVGLILILVVVLFFKEFKILCFNPDYAKVIGLPVRFLEFLLAGITVLSVAVGIQAVGLVLMAALLITPAAGARFWTDNLLKMIVLSTIFGAVSGVVGSLVSYTAPSMPTGPWVVMCLSVLAVISIWFAPRKGLISRYSRQRGIKKRMLKENILKAFYHTGEEHGNFSEGRSFEELGNKSQILKKQLLKGLGYLKSENLVRSHKKQWFMTKKGLSESIRVVRLHRLWEMYLNQRLKLQPDHVHNDAEAIEHIITPEIEAQLEKELDYPKTDPHQSKIPDKQ